LVRLRVRVRVRVTAPPTGAGALPLRALELSGAALCSTKLAGQLAEEPA